MAMAAEAEAEAGFGCCGRLKRSRSRRLKGG